MSDGRTLQVLRARLRELLLVECAADKDLLLGVTSGVMRSTGAGEMSMGETTDPADPVDICKGEAN